jgi:hypothetical protein
VRHSICDCQTVLIRPISRQLQRIVDASENRLTSVPERLLSISQHARKVARRKSNRRRTFLSIGGTFSPSYAER